VQTPKKDAFLINKIELFVKFQGLPPEAKS